MKFYYLLLVLCILLPLNLLAQEDDLPKSFLMKKYHKAFDLKSKEYEENLFEASSNNMNKAYSAYMKMLREMEFCAKKMGHDINGVKLWIKFFFDNDGTIDHVAYHLKPKSKEINTEILDKVLQEFTKDYKLSIQTENKFSHYGSASFPVVTKPKKTLDNTQE